MFKLLLSYLLHSTILISIVYLVIRFNLVKSEYLKDSLLKLALIGAFFSVGASYIAPSFKVISITPPTIIQNPITQRTKITGDLAANTALVSNKTEIVQPISETLASPKGSMKDTKEQVKAVPKSFSFALLVKILIGLYLAIVAVLTIRIISAWLELNQTLKNRNFLTNTKQNQLLDNLKLNYNTKVKLSCSKSLNSPIALANNEICLPERALQLKQKQQETMLAHELSHIIRKDPTWLIVTTIIETIFFFQPLNRLISKHLRQTSDIICDDFAMRQTADKISLAKCLATVASWQINDRKLNLVSNMANNNNLKPRVKRILSGSLLKPTSNLKRLLFGSALFLLVIIFVPKLDVIAQNNTTEINSIADIRQVWISTVGNMPAQFNDGYSELLSLPRGTTFIIEERFQNTAKKLIVTEENGQKQFEYFVNGETNKADDLVITWYQSLLGEWARATQAKFIKEGLSEPKGFLVAQGFGLFYTKRSAITEAPNNTQYFSEDKETFYSTNFIGQSRQLNPLNLTYTS